MPARMCLLDKLATLKPGLILWAEGRAHVIACLSDCRNAVAAQSVEVLVDFSSKCGSGLSRTRTLCTQMTMK